VTVVACLVASAALLLAAAGVTKARRPDHTALALRRAGLPLHRAAVRGLAAAELVIGVAGLVAVTVPGARGGEAARAALSVLALLYAALTAVVLAAKLRALPLETCGCFGEPDTPATWLHVGLNAGAAAGALALAVGRETSWALGPRLARDPGVGAAAAVLVLTIAYLSFVALTDRPATDWWTRQPAD
jgi:hypothetical protein